ncbi:MAG: N-acetylmuramoyl-L-alanine amidase [Lachnospiraceae bacterium]|nr:N-acetylmuramoyl-L-alanine amidase [Lachnospiraceae bacterium]
MSNSPLVSHVHISPNRNSPRSHVIDTVSIHCMAGNLSIEACGNEFASPKRGASSNYGIGSDGRIGMYVEEGDRSWCSSNAANDNRAVTIEVANDGGAETGWHVSDAAYRSLIHLLTDICRRNNIPQLRWRGDRSLVGQVDRQNMTVHRWFAPKSCPGDYLYDKHGEIAREVNERLHGTAKKQPAAPPGPAAPNPGPASKGARPEGRYVVQVGAFGDGSRARTRVAKLRAAGFNAIVIQRGGMNVVQGGVFSDRGNAQRLVDRLKNAGFDSVIA